MRTKRYIPCSGLAFGDREDMEMLHVYAKKGWVFQKYKLGCYVLHKEEPIDLIFSYDMQKVKKDEIEEYISIYEHAGWKLVDRASEISFFCAPRGTINPHSDQATRNQQFRMYFLIGLTLFVIGLVIIASCFLIPNAGEANIAGLGGAFIGGGGMLSIGCYARMKGKRIRTDFTKFRANGVIALIGILILGVSCFVGFVKNEHGMEAFEVFIAGMGIVLLVQGVAGCKRSIEYVRWKKEVQLQEENEHD